MKDKKQLYLVMQKEFFNEILAGTKKEEYRDFTDFYISRLCELDNDDEIIGTKKYETVKLQMGYSKDAPQMIVEVKDIIIMQDDNNIADEDIKTENLYFTIELGKILETINLPTV